MRVGNKTSRIPATLGNKMAQIPSTVGNRDTFLKPDQIVGPPRNQAYSPNPIQTNSANTGLTVFMPKGLGGGGSKSSI